MEKLKAQGYWIVSSDGSAQQSYDEVDYACPIGLVVGSEGFGISPLLLKRSDFVVKIPMFGHVNSLNASVATAIFLSEIALKRTKHNTK
jgi:23S rRNA (guanosine2251-2'-O)-methyltransferase